jgi:probable rRNA maturation factor
MKFQINQLEDFAQINQSQIQQDLQKLQELAPEVLKSYKTELVTQSEGRIIQINFVSDQEIQELNKLHRSKDSPTDVLSWGFINQDLLPHEMAGEIYVSIQTCQRQAKEKSHSLEHETIYLIVHGLLHVFDYDHQTDEQEAEMDMVQNQIMEGLK